MSSCGNATAETTLTGQSTDILEIPTEEQHPTASATEKSTPTEIANSTKEPQKIYTQEELEAMVPTREEMVAFLNSDEIDRVEENGTVVPLGFESIEIRFGFYTANLHAIAWEKPVLADVEIDGETFKTILIPSVTVQNGNDLNPTFLYIVAGDEGAFGIAADIAFSEESTSGRAVNTVKDLSWYIQRGRQFKAQMAFDATSEISYQNLNPNFPSYGDFLARFGNYFRQIVTDITAGKNFNNGIVVGAPALFSFQGLFHPYP